MILPYIEIAPSDYRGRGVFATEAIAAGTLVEVSPVLVLSEEERVEVEKTSLYNYIFEWGPDSRQACVAWGYVALYNHSYHANCRYDMDFAKQEMRITTVRAINKGEEMFTNYNAEPDSEERIWFEAK
jgi:SET domain-containing protein